MQFLIVQAVKNGKFAPIEANTPVLIDGVENGSINNVLKLDKGTIDVSVKIPGAEEITIDLEDTTLTEPMIVTVEVA